MQLEILDFVLEAMLFVSGDAVSLNYIQEKLELQESELNNAVERLSKKFGGRCGIHLLQFDGKIQFATNPEYADPVSAVLNPIREKELSRASLETVAIIAYKQPITRLEIEEVRGVNSDYAVTVLLENKLIKIVGRKDAIGKPYLFGTTEDFLKRFQIGSLDDLPSYEELIGKIEVLNMPRNEALYNRFEIADEEAAATDDAELPEPEIPDFLAGENVDKIE